MKIKTIGPEIEKPKPKPTEEKEKGKLVKKEEGQEEVKKTTFPTSKKTATNAVGGAFRIILSIILAIGAYFTARHYLPETLSVFWLELAFLIISLFVLKAISVAYGGRDSRVSSAVGLLMFAIFAWQLVQGYADYEPPVKQDNQRKTSGITEVMTLYPRAEPYVFHLKEVGDETPYFKPPTGGLYMFNYSSHNYGYEIIFNDGTVYQGNPNRSIPEKKHPVIKIRATSPNQFVNVRLSNR